MKITIEAETAEEKDQQPKPFVFEGVRNYVLAGQSATQPILLARGTHVQNIMEANGLKMMVESNYESQLSIDREAAKLNLLAKLHGGMQIANATANGRNNGPRIVR